jgi:glucose-fructose oxidoreductase
MNRRIFLGSMAAPLVWKRQAGAVPANDRITVAFIGTGTRGGDGLIPMFLPVPECQAVAVCDAWQERREKRAKQIEDYYSKQSGNGTYKGCAQHADFREVLARKDVDAVVIATPDHWHIPLAIMAARAGKDIYLEKPLGISLVQAKQLREALKKNNRVFQYGTQQRSTPHIRYGCELVRNGRVGKVHTVVVLAPAGTRGGSTEEQPVPAGFDYEMWTGPAPMRPYSDLKCKAAWPGHYYIYDYCLGFLAGWGAHPLDVAQWGLGSDHTSPVEYEGVGYVPKEGLFTATTNWTVRCRYANGVTMHFMDDHTNLTKFIGDEGWISLSRNSIDADPKTLIDPEMKPGRDNNVTHARDFVQAVRTRGNTVAPFEAAVHSDTISHLSDVAIRTRRKIRWDPVKEVIIDDAEAMKMLDRSARSPWKV